MTGGSKIPFTPRWQRVEGCAVLVIREHYGWLCAEYEFDDLMQEAYLVYMKVKARYPHIDNQKWFLGMFTVSLRNKLQNMARKTGRTISLEELPQGLPEAVLDFDEGYARRLLAELPERARQLIHEVCFSVVEADGRAAYRKLREFLPSLA